MRRLLSRLRRWLRRPDRPAGGAPERHALTAVEYEAVCLIAYEGRKAYERAREQARYCRDRGSEDGRQFWNRVAAEVALRTKGHNPEMR
jgi:ABC-type Fe3+ transport system substrate-binding protein